MAPLLHAAGYRTIRYDQRGAGASTTEDVEFSRVDDLVAVLVTRGIRRAVLVGNSLGGDARVRHGDRGRPSASSRSSASPPASVASTVATRPRRPPSSRRWNASRTPTRSIRPPSTDIDVRVWVDGPVSRRAASRRRSATWSTRWTVLDPDRPAGPASAARSAGRRRVSPRSAVRSWPWPASSTSARWSSTARHLEAERPERPGGHLAGRRAHDRDGAAGPPGGHDRRVPGSPGTLGVAVDGRSRRRHTGQWSG